jgi:hypothetical protein
VFRDSPNNVQALWGFYRVSHPLPHLRDAVREGVDALAIVPFGNEDYVLVLRHPRWELVVSVGLLLGCWGVTLVAGWRRRQGLPIALAASAVIVAVVGIFSLSRASGGIYAYFATWMAACPLLTLFGLGVALLAPTGPDVGEGRPAALHARNDRRRLPPARLGTTAACAGLALVGAAAVLRSDFHTEAVKDVSPAMAGAGSVELARVAASRYSAIIAAQHPAPGTVAIDIASHDAWPQVAGAVLELDRKGIESTVSPAGWSLLFGHERLPGRPNEATYSFYTDAELTGAHLPAGRVLLDTDGVALVSGPPGRSP